MADLGIASLRDGSRGKTIEVRLIRKWCLRQRGQDRAYIFVDQEGNAIQAFCVGKDEMTVDTKLEVGVCYRIKGYACTGAEKNSAVLSKDVTIRMGAATSITDIEDKKDIPANYFEFGDYNDITRMSISRDKVIDYLGVLESIEDGRTKKSSKAYVNLRITDSSHEMAVITIWDEIAHVLDKFPRREIKLAKKPTIIATTSLRFNQYTGRLDLQSTPATHVYLSPECPAAYNLIKNYNPALVDQNKHLTVFAAGSERTTISDIVTKTHPIPPEKSFMCKAFIMEFVTNGGWYYMSCIKCNGTAHRSDALWFCTQCGDISEIRYKSRLVLFISDGPSQLKATMFDDTLEVLLGKKFHNLITEDGYDDNTQLPEPIEATVGNKWYFVIKPQREQYPNSPKFIVRQILHVDAVDNPLLLETPTPSTPPQAITATTQETVTKKRLDFDSEEAPSALSDTKRIRYKD